MFVGDEVWLDVSFASARERLTRLGDSGALAGPAEDAYGPGLTRVGVAGVSKLVQVQVRQLSWTDLSAGLALRWEATGPGGGLFPVLDADLKLAPDGPGTMLTMAGSYRPPLGPLGEALDRVVRHLFAVGLSLQTAADLPGEVVRERLSEALDQLDDVIREIRDYAFTSGGDGGADPAPSGPSWPAI